VILDIPDTGNIFGGNAQCPPFIFRSDDSPKVHDTFRDDDVRFTAIEDRHG